MKIFKVLVFPCGSEIGLEIHNSLKWSKDVTLIGASSVPDHGKYVYKNYIEGIPFVDEPNFLKEIVKVVKKYKIDCIFPAHDNVVLKLSGEVKKIGCKLITSPYKTCDICRSKKKTYDYFCEILRVPKMYGKSDKKINFPVFLKPDVGQGSKETYTANSHEEINFYLKKDQHLLILEYLPGDEYTIDCFTDRHGLLRFVGPRRRARISNGISVNSFPVKDPEFFEIAELVNKRLKFRGVWFFQLKRAKDGKLCLMEIAPRIGGTMGLTRNMGVNLALLSIYDASDVDVEIAVNKFRIEVDRALISRFKVGLNYEHVYIDLDDTILLQGKVNPWIIAFLYQCLNNNLHIHLLSRHYLTYKEATYKALKEHRIDKIFDDVVNIRLGKEKYQYIREKKAIFVDDSYAERKKASEKLGIPIFDISSIESLLDWHS